METLIYFHGDLFFLKYQYRYIEIAREAAKKRGLGVMLYSIFF